MSEITTKITYTGDSQTKIYAIPFDYLSQTHVHITVDGVEKGFTFLTSYSVSLTEAPAIGSEIVIQRITPHDDQFITWQDGSVLQADDMNAADLQTLFVLQENMTELQYLNSRLHTFDVAIASMELLLKEAEARIAQDTETSKAYRDASQDWYNKIASAFGPNFFNTLFVLKTITDGGTAATFADITTIYDGGTAATFADITTIYDGMSNRPTDWYEVNPIVIEALRGRSIVDGILQTNGEIIFVTD